MYLILCSLAFSLSFCSSNQSGATVMDTTGSMKNPYFSHSDTSSLNVDESEWKKILSPQLFHIAREKGTERPFSSRLEDNKEVGIYHCAVCGISLFCSDTKFESGCGWPSFFDPINKNTLIYRSDNSYGMRRTEILCARCSSHLGHVFEDGPPPTGLRYCLNGVSLHFKADGDLSKK